MPTKPAQLSLALNCETDFAARNEGFIAMANKFADIALENFPATLEALLALPFEGSVTIGEKVGEQVGVIGEKIELGRYEPITGAQILTYNHSNNKRSVAVALNKSDANSSKLVATSPCRSLL
jgi:elongation factor Ts